MNTKRLIYKLDIVRVIETGHLAIVTEMSSRGSHCSLLFFDEESALRKHFLKVAWYNQSELKLIANTVDLYNSVCYTNCID